MPDPAAPPFSTMRLEDVTKRVQGRLQRAPAGQPAYALIFGAGFSYPLIPLASAMVRDVPWWLHWTQSAAAGDAFPERTAVPADRQSAFEEFERGFWNQIVAAPERPSALALDAKTGRPDVAKHDAIFAAYQALMDPRLPEVLGDPGLRRGYMRAAIERVGKRVNRAHAFLAGILGAQLGDEWRARFRRPFCRTVFTTNFDPLLQRSLQLVQTLYFMSDRPETLEPPRDDEHPAIHLLYTHGSVHRHVLLNTEEEIHRAQSRNASALAEYLKHKGVIVVGYSGWHDTVMSALQACEAFDGNLYWINVHSPQAAAQNLSQEVVEFLAARRGNAFYVQATADEAMAALHAELGLGDEPSFVRDPLAPMRAALDDVVLPDGSVGAAAGAPKGQQILANMQVQLARTRERLKLAHEVFLDPTIAEAGKSSFEVRRAVAASEMQKADAAWAEGKREEALAIWRGVAQSPAGLEPDTVAQAWQNSGVALLALGRLDEASQAYEQGLAVHGTREEARFHLLTARGYLREQRQAWQDAEADYRAALEIARAQRNADWQASALNDLAGVLMEDQVNQLDDAALLFRQTLALAGAPAFQRMRATNNLGVIEYKRKDLVEMRQLLEQAHELDPESFYPPVNLALMLLLEGKTDAALAAYARALPAVTDADFLRRAVKDLHEAQPKFALDPAAVARAVALLEARATDLGG
jgi:tetratricopeptide (TPR) repeat protein